MNWLSRMLSDPQGVPDDGRVSALLMVLAYIALGAYSVVRLGQHFDAQAFGLGAGALAGGIGGWFGFRRGN